MGLRKERDSLRFLVISVSAGDGHNAIGRALIEELNKRGHTTLMIDYHKGVSPLRQWFNNDWYFWVLSNCPGFSHRIYERLKRRDTNKKPPRLSAYNFMFNSPKSIKLVEKTLADFKPDVVFSTHSYPAALMSKWKKEGRINCQCFYLVSDYVIHLYTELTTNNDYILTPCSDFHPTLEKLGYDKKQFLNIGIPVQTKFSTISDKKALRLKFGLNPELFTVLCLSGGAGYGRIDLIVKNLLTVQRPLQIIVVNGRNEKMKQKIDNYLAKKKINSVLNLAYCNNIDELMGASDLMLGKLGGVGVTEAFNKELPLISVGQAPFQEYDNGLYLSEKKAIIKIDKVEEIPEVLTDLFDHPEKITALKANIQKLRKPNATTDFADFLEGKNL